MTLAATHPTRSISSARVRPVSSAPAPDMAPTVRTASPVFRGILFAGLFSLPFWGGIALAVGLAVR